MNLKTSLTILLTGAVSMATAVVCMAAPMQDSHLGLERAGWLLQRASLTDKAVVGYSSQVNDTDDYSYTRFSGSNGKSENKPLLHILSSLVLPGSGEAMMGYKRGYLMMAMDIFAWTQVIKYGNDGDEYQQDFFEYADKYWSEDRLVAAYSVDDEDHLGLIYFPDVQPVTDVEGLEGNLPLWVSKTDDHWEYYENLGKWEQFVFGWDDFVSPYDNLHNNGYVPTGGLDDLRQPFTSPHRETYRAMMRRSDDAYGKRDNWLVVNLGLRVFSILQTAYLQGVLSGGGDHKMEVSGHQISFLAQPSGFRGGTMGAAVSF